MNEDSLRLDATQITAEVYNLNDKGIYYVKVSIPSLGLYINSITVRPSPKYPEKGMWLQWPSFFAGRWIKPVEWSNTSTLRGLLEDAVWRAIDTYNGERSLPDEITPEELNKMFPT